MRRRRTVIVLASLAVCLVAVGFWALMRPVAFDWTGDLTVHGKRASLHVTRVMLEPWSYVDGGAPNVRGILAQATFRHSPKQFFLYKEYRVQLDDASADEVDGVSQLIVRDAGRNLAGTRPSMVVTWSEGKTRCELMSPVQPERHPFRRPALKVDQLIVFKDGSNEELTASLPLDR